MSWPAYLELQWTGELAERARRAVELLSGPRCRVCPWRCRVDRLADGRALCRVGRHAIVASAHAHHGEEDCLSGRYGSGTIFFAGCNLRCVFCQNFEISQLVAGHELLPGELATEMLALQDAGCHNINLVTPEHVVPQILEALWIAIEEGLRLPLVYNSSAYDGMESLRLLDGVVDIYMPDFKFWSEDRAKRYCRRGDYPEVARAAILEMRRQVGDLVVGPGGLAQRGVLLRHLVMPGMLDETEAILRWVAAELGRETYVNLMPQYRPDDLVGHDRYEEINRRVSRHEYARARSIAEGLGLLRLDTRGPVGGLLVTAG